MKFINLDGSEQTIDIKPSQYKRKGNASKNHCRIGNILDELFSRQNILEEFVIPRSGNLKLDFFIPSLNIAIEVDGAQHENFVKHFHGDISGFRKAKENDIRKERWCEINNINLIRINYSISDEDVRKMLYG